MRRFFLDIVHTFDFSQCVSIPTPGDNVLDLLLCNAPDIVDNVCVVPGISDQKIVLMEITRSFRRNHATSVYDTGDYKNIIS